MCFYVYSLFLFIDIFFKEVIRLPYYLKTN